MKRSPKKKITIISIIVILILAIVFFGSRCMVFVLLKGQIESRIDKLKEDGIIVKYDSLNTNPWQCAVTMVGVDVTVPSANTTCKQPLVHFTADRLALEGFEIIPLLISKKLSIASIKLDSPKIQYAEHFKLPSKKKKARKLTGFEIGSVILVGADVQQMDSTGCKLTKRIKLSLELADLELSHMGEQNVQWALGKVKAHEIVYEMPLAFYTLRIKDVTYHARNKSLNVDSLLLIPTYDKASFAHKVGHQTDRIECVMPSLHATEVDLKTLTKTTLHVQSIAINKVKLQIYRDKRVTDSDKHITSLPVKALHALPIVLQIDTLTVADSYVQYEEVPEEGTTPGLVFFDQLNARVVSLTNNGTTGAVMQASANFMDAGKLQATFTLPAEPNKPYTAKGSLKNFSLPKINSILTPMINTKIETGTLHEMTFNFKYNDYRSDGELMLDYSDLKIVSLQKENKTERKFVTFLLGLFVKKNLDKDVSKDKKSGTILFYRNKERSLFNYWWKSLLTGIKSVYNIDKVMDTDGKK